MKKAVVLFSGGLDSSTCLYLALRERFTPTCLCIDYGQRHAVELERARTVAAAAGVSDLVVVKVDLRAIGGSALTDAIEVPKHADVSALKSEIPVTYVPARNSIFLSLALGLAEVRGARDIFIGVNAVDYSGYPDCRPEFIASFEALATLATKAGVDGERLNIHTPLAGMSKAQIIQLGVAAGLDYALTHSCYAPESHGLACGFCDSCLLRKKGFEEAGVKDPTRYTL
jgi:7-cyano-7-deazaguanine synthase